MDKNLLLKYAKKNNLDKQILESILLKILINFFKDKKNIDIKKYIISIQVKENIIIIKSLKWFLNFEFNIYKEEILKIFYKKIEKIWFKKNFKIFFK